MNGDRLAGDHHLEVERRPTPVVAEGHRQARDRRRHRELAGHGAHDGLCRDLADAVRRHEAEGAVVVAERIRLGEAMVAVRLVHRGRREVEEGPCMPAVGHEQARRFGVRGEIALEVVGLRNCEVQDVVEVVGHAGEVGLLEVHRHALHAG